MKELLIFLAGFLAFPALLIAAAYILGLFADTTETAYTPDNRAEVK